MHSSLTLLQHRHMRRLCFGMSTQEFLRTQVVLADPAQLQQLFDALQALVQRMCSRVFLPAAYQSDCLYAM